MDWTDNQRGSYPGHMLFEGYANEHPDSHRHSPYDLYAGRVRPLPLRPCFYEDLHNMSLTRFGESNAPSNDALLRQPPSNDALLRQASSNDALLRQARKCLFEQIEKAENFYSTFKSDFDNEINAIMKYSPKELWKELWELKVKKRAEKQPQNANNILSSSHDDTIPDSEKTFQDMESKLSESLQAVLSAFPNMPTSIYQDRLERLKEKVKSAEMYIIDLVHKIEKDHEYMDDLLAELKEFKGVIKVNDGIAGAAPANKQESSSKDGWDQGNEGIMDRRASSVEK